MSDMFYDASAKPFEQARILRENLTESESILWNKLSKKQILNLRFRRQHPILNYIVDFYCHSKRIVIEPDGEIHNQEDQINYDKIRQNELELPGIKVIRFSNIEIYESLDTVLDRIKELVISIK